jgi:hypothetical protein
MKTMNEQLGNLITVGLDYNLFWHLEVTEYNINIQGYYTKRLENYVISKGFKKYDYLYADRPDLHEYTNGNCRILLTKNK